VGPASGKGATLSQPQMCFGALPTKSPREERPTKPLGALNQPTSGLIVQRAVSTRGPEANVRPRLFDQPRKFPRRDGGAFLFTHVPLPKPGQQSPPARPCAHQRAGPPTTTQRPVAERAPLRASNGHHATPAPGDPGLNLSRPAVLPITKLFPLFVHEAPLGSTARASHHDHQASKAFLSGPTGAVCPSPWKRGPGRLAWPGPPAHKGPATNGCSAVVSLRP